jgi:hypothetical protein
VTRKERLFDEKRTMRFQQLDELLGERFVHSAVEVAVAISV